VATSLPRKLIAEFVGTFLLVFLAVGAAVFGIATKVGVAGGGLGQVWLFILALLVGAVIAVGIWLITRSTEELPAELVAGSER
jgi:glycerol uptake facilitator-like aquaporin